MSGWKHAPITTPGGWAPAPTEAWCNWKPESPKALGRKPIIPEIPTAMLLQDDGPTKYHKLKNGALFDFITMDIINVINDYLIGIEHYETLNTTVECIKLPRSTLPRMHIHKRWIPYIYFGNDLIYQETKFNWAERYYIKTPCGFRSDTHLIEHNNK